MSGYAIVSDSSCDLPPELAKEKGITVVPFYVSFDDKNYFKEKEEIQVRDFYKKMVQNPKVFPKSSTPAVQDYANAFETFVKDGVSVICICISTKFSGSMQCALNAADIVKETYPQAQITVIDATVNTVLQGLYVLEAAAMRENGVPYEKAVEKLESLKHTGRIFFTIGNMEYLRKGGRIGKLIGVTGSLLGIKPIITLKEGEIFPSGIARARVKSLKKVIDLLLAYLKELNADLKEYSLAIGYGYDYQEACSFKTEVLNALLEHFSIKDIPIYQIGATIGVHTGPYPLGVGVIKKYM